MAKKKKSVIDKYDVMLIVILIASIIITYFSFKYLDNATWQTLGEIAKAIMTGTVFAIVGKKVVERAIRK